MNDEIIPYGFEVYSDSEEAVTSGGGVQWSAAFAKTTCNQL